MDNIFERAEEAAHFIHSQFGEDIQLSIISGSGLSGVLSDYTLLKSIPFTEVPNLVPATFHNGEIQLLEYQDKKLIGLTGRLHYYEGYSSKEITFPVRVLKQLGIKTIIMSNASGGLNENYKGGELVLVKDHINLLPEHPLRGEQDDRLGLRFPDMSNAYDKELRQLVTAAAEKLNIKLKEGVYVGFQGPSLETPAEYKFLHTIGADMTGMSTVPEVIVANHAGIKVICFSIVTNMCYPPEILTATTLEEVIEMAEKAVVPLRQIINAVIPTLA